MKLDLRSDEPAPALSAASFPKATSRGRYFIPQSGAGTSLAAGTR